MVLIELASCLSDSALKWTNKIVDKLWKPMDMGFMPVLLTTALLALFIYWLVDQMYLRRLSFPPGPTPLPLLGNLLQLDVAEPHKTFLAWRKTFGPIYTIWMPKPMVIFADYQSITNALTKGTANELSGRPKGHLWSAFYGEHQLDGDGIILAEKERWSINRNFAIHAFKGLGLGNSRMEGKIVYQVNQLVKYIKKEMGTSTSVVMDPHTPLAYAIGNIIQDIVFGKNYDFGEPEFIEFKELIDAVLKDTASPSMLLANSYWILSKVLPVRTRFIRNGMRIQDWFRRLVHEHEANQQVDSESADFMDAYIREMRKKASPHFNELTLCLSSGDLWTGGMETTVTTIRWAIIYLIHHPEVQNRCQQEIDEVFGTFDPSYEKKPRMHYVNAMIAELQRIVNVLPWSIPHRALESVTVDGFHIPKGTEVMPQYGCVLYDDNVFPEPDMFRPERFLTSEGMYKAKNEARPFGMGPRMCLGENIAKFELFLLVCNLLQQFNFKPVVGKPLPSLKRNKGMTSVPSEFECLIERRDMANVRAEVEKSCG